MIIYYRFFFYETVKWRTFNNLVKGCKVRGSLVFWKESIWIASHHGNQRAKLEKFEGQKQPQEVFCEKCVLKNFASFTGKHLSSSLFLNKVAGLGLQLYFKRDSNTGVFLLNLRNFKNIYFEEHLRKTASGRFYQGSLNLLLLNPVSVNFLN